jgi:Type III flagellar switch regulator (C-ring) FliN C-term
MVLVMQWQRGALLTADVFRQRMAVRGDTVARLGVLLGEIELPCQAAVQSLNAAPVKCSLTGISLRGFNPANLQEHRFCLSSPKGKIPTFVGFDRAFENLCCDLALGGAGVESNPEDHLRPSSRFEKKLAARMALLIAQQLCGHFNASTKLAFLCEPQPPISEKSATIRSEDYVVVKVLVNVFSSSGEIQLLLSHDGVCTALDGKAPEKPASTVTAREALSACTLELGVFLEPISMPLTDVVSMQVGTMLPLQIGPDTLVSVRCETEKLFRGGFSHDAGKFDVRLVDVA